MHVRGWRATHIPGRPARLSEIRARQRYIVERRGQSTTMAVLGSRRRFLVVFVCHDCLFRATATTPIFNAMQHYYVIMHDDVYRDDDDDDDDNTRYINKNNDKKAKKPR